MRHEIYAPKYARYFDQLRESAGPFENGILVPHTMLRSKLSEMSCTGELLRFQRKGDVSEWLPAHTKCDKARHVSVKSCVKPAKQVEIATLWEDMFLSSYISRGATELSNLTFIPSGVISDTVG